jgi:lipoprotein NlpI
MRRLLLVLALGLGLTAPVAARQGSGKSLEELFKAARAAQAAGKKDEALRLADQAVKEHPKESGAYALRGLIREEQDQYQGALEDFTKVVTLEPDAAQFWNRRGAVQFKLGRFKESVADFDRFVKLMPDEANGHWMRGISYYYAGRYEDGRKQFEGYENVDTNDVENAVWCYLCTAKTLGVGRARAGLLKIGRDKRVPMMEVYALFAGKLKPADVLKAAEAGKPEPAKLNRQLFYAHLYLGLYYEANGDEAKALEHLTRATEHRIGHYMWDVARVGRDRLQEKTRK